MSTDLLRWSLIWCFLLSLGSVPEALAQSVLQIKSYRKGELKTYFGVDFFSANQNFDNSGSTEGLTSSGDYYYLFTAPIGLRYSLNDSWAMDLGLQFGVAESKTSDLTYKATRSTSTLNQSYFSTDFILMRSPFELIPEIELINPTEKYDNTTDNVMTSEGVAQATGALRLQYSLGYFLVLGRIGYTYRDQGRSSLMPYMLAGAFDTGQTAFGLGVVGFQSISSDKDRDTPFLRNNVISRVEGGARKFYSVDPSNVDVVAFLSLNLSPRWSFDLNAGYNVAGSNYAQGPHGGGTITLNWDLFTKKKLVPREMSAPLTRESQLSTEKDIQMFKEEVQDGVDQNLFKARPTEKPKAAADSSLPNKTIDKNQLQKELDETELKIKLKKRR